MWPWPVKLAGRDLRLGPQIAMDSSNIPLRPLWNSQDFTYVPLACGDYKLKKANFHFGTEIQLFWNKRNSFLSMSSVVTWHSGQMVLFCDTLQLSENLKKKKFQLFFNFFPTFFQLFSNFFPTFFQLFSNFFPTFFSTFFNFFSTFFQLFFNFFSTFFNFFSCPEQLNRWQCPSLACLVRHH